MVGIYGVVAFFVAQRTNEIGLRMALGATRNDVLAQFALEAVTLSLFGGILGMVLGVGGAFVAAQTLRENRRRGILAGL